MIEVHEVVKKYNRLVAVDKVSFSLAEGECVVLMGPSGSGKSTLLNLVAGLDSPSGGRITVAGKVLSQLNQEEKAALRRDEVGIVFQDFHLIPYLNALENIMLAQYIHSLPDREEALQALERVGLRDRADHLPSQLSGGEQQRVAIARAIINEPSVLLADEPTGNLDASNEEKVLDIFRGLKEEGKGLLLATHNREVAEIGDKILRLHHGRVEGES